jgi:acetyl esterase/lipase
MPRALWHPLSRLAARPGTLPGGTAVLALALTSLAAPAAEAAGRGGFEVRAVKDLAYYDGPGADKVKHKLDLYLPRGHKGFPVLFFVHGGAWLHGDKNFFGVYSSLGSFFARQGVGVVVTNYRLSPGVQHPEHVKDVARAFAWAHRHIADYGGRPDQLFVCGHSAGAHLISLLVTDETYLRAEGLRVKDVKGAIPLSGVYVIPDKLLPAVFPPDPGARRQASPLYHVKRALPPFLILYADQDYPGCGKAPSEAFRKALTDKGNEAATLEVRESNHFHILMAAALRDSPVSKAILGFITAQTRKQ